MRIVNPLRSTETNAVLDPALVEVEDRSSRSSRRARRGSGNPYQDFALRWWWLIAIGLVVGLAAAVAYARYGPVPYTSTAYLQVVPPPDASSKTDVDALVTNTATQAKSPYAYALVSGALSGKVNLTATDLATMVTKGQINIEPISGSSFISIAVTDTNPADAQLIAQTYVSAFAKDVDSRNQQTLTQRAKDLAQQIDETKQNLATAQLQQREQDLSKQLRDQRGQLLQIQTNYLQMLQSQLIANRLAPDGSGQVTADSAGAQKAAQLQDQMRASMEATVKQLQQQVDALNARIAAQPGGAGAVADQQRLTDLLAQEHALQSAPSASQLDHSIAVTKAKLSAAEVYQNMLDLQKQVHDLQLQQVGAPPDQVAQLNARLADAQNQLAAATGSYKASGFTFDPSTISITLSTLQGQLKDQLAQQSQTNQGPSLQQVQSQISALQSKLSSQSDLTSLIQQRTAAEGDLSTAKAQLFQLQQAHIQQLANQPAKLTPEQQQQAAKLDGTTAQVQTQWQQLALQQQADVQKNITDLNNQLNQVRDAEQKTSATDLAAMVSLAPAYQARLNSLTTDYVNTQNAAAAPGPVEQYGAASNPISTLSKKKVFGAGVAGGVAVAVGIAYLIEFLGRRKRPSLAPGEAVMLPFGTTSASMNGTDGGWLPGMAPQLAAGHRTRRRRIGPETTRSGDDF